MGPIYLDLCSEWGLMGSIVCPVVPLVIWDKHLASLRSDLCTVLLQPWFPEVTETYFFLCFYMFYNIFTCESKEAHTKDEGHPTCPCPLLVLILSHIVLVGGPEFCIPHISNQLSLPTYRPQGFFFFLVVFILFFFPIRHINIWLQRKETCLV